MQILRELIQIINRTKLRGLRKIGFPFEADNRLAEFYDHVADGMSDEKEIAEQLLGKPVLSGGYRRLKSDLNDRLIDALFLVDLTQPSYNKRQVAYYEIYKNWSASKILIGKNARFASVQVAERALRQALEYEFNDVALDISRHLRLHYGTIVGDKRKYEHYATECDRLQALAQAENLAEGLYAELIIHFVRQKADQEHITEQATTSYGRLVPLLEQMDSYNLRLYANLIQLASYTSAHDYEGAARACDDMIQYFEAKSYTASVPLQIAYYQKLVCYLQLRRFDEQALPIDRCLRLMEEGSFNWFKFQETYLVLALHTGKYERAYDTYRKSVKHSRFNSQPASLREYWRVLEAYLHFLVEVGELPTAAEDKRFSKFRIGRFLNQTPIFAKDKRGVNIGILIVQILFLVTRGQYGDTIDKIDAVEQYCRRYLYQNDTLRAFYFIKALLVLPKSGFHREGVRRKAEQYLEKLAQEPLERAGTSAAHVEIIPFERLWEMLISSLKTKFYKM